MLRTFEFRAFRDEGQHDKRWFLTNSVSVRVTVFVKEERLAIRTGARNPPDNTMLRSQEIADQALFLFVLDAGEEFCSQPGDCLRLIEWQTVVDFAAGEMTRLTSRLKDRLNLSRKIRLPCGGDDGRCRKVLWAYAEASRVCAMASSESETQKQCRNENGSAHCKHDVQ